MNIKTPINFKYGNTNTYFIDGLLIDTDYAGTMPAFYREIKKKDIAVSDIKYVLATHYHPDHVGLIGELMTLGVKLILIEHQLQYVHFSDAIFQRQPFLNYKPIDEHTATVISIKESRTFLEQIGIRGEIVPTNSHSADGIALILDCGDCFVGDLEPIEYIEGYADNQALAEDWRRIISYDLKTVYYSHVNKKVL